MAYDCEKEDPTFIDDLLKSKQSEVAIARHLNAKGLRVVLNPTHIRESVSEISAYSDHSDLLVMLPVEVKQRNFAFTGKDDYPYESLMIDTARAFENKPVKPYAYYVTNPALTVALIVMRYSFRHLERKTLKYKDTSTTREYVFCPMDYVVEDKLLS